MEQDNGVMDGEDGKDVRVVSDGIQDLHLNEEEQSRAKSVDNDELEGFDKDTLQKNDQEAVEDNEEKFDFEKASSTKVEEIKSPDDQAETGNHLTAIDTDDSEHETLNERNNNSSDFVVNNGIDDDETKFVDNNEDNDEDEFGDFDEFDDFNEFAEATDVETSTNDPINSKILHGDDFLNSASLQDSVLHILSDLDAVERTTDAEALPSFLSSRASAVYEQLSTIPSTPALIDFKRSAVRRMFLLSLGVPLDLDEILPKKTTKRLRFASKNSRLSSETPPSRSSMSTPNRELLQVAKEKEFAQETDLSLEQWRRLASTSLEALANMNEEELTKHIETLKKAQTEAEVVLQKWSDAVASRQKDKEAFESVISSLVDYAQRLKIKPKRN